MLLLKMLQVSINYTTAYYQPINSMWEPMAYTTLCTSAINHYTQQQHLSNCKQLLLK